MSIVCVVCFNYHIEKVIALRPVEINLSGRIEPLQYSDRETDNNISDCNPSINLFCMSWTDVCVFKISYIYLVCLFIFAYPQFIPSSLSIALSVKWVAHATFKFCWMFPHYWTMNTNCILNSRLRFPAVEGHHGIHANGSD